MIIIRIIHLFKWKLVDIVSHLDLIKNQGFDAIQISPIQYSKFMDMTDDWWKLYQPFGLTIGNAIGTKDDLINLCTEANARNLRIFCDVVLNHVANDDHDHLTPHINVDSALNSTEYLKEKKYIYNWEDRYELTNYCIGLPSLKLENHTLQDKVISFLDELIDCGVSGFRIDAAKHMKLPNEGSDFFTRVFKNLKNKDLFNYAEVIFSPPYIIDSYSEYMNVLTDCYSNDKNKVVSYIDSHDLQHEFKTTANISPDEILESYKSLCSNYKNTIFYVREFTHTWKDNDVKIANYLTA